MFCTNCGSKLPDDVKFCTQCGAPVTKVIPRSDLEQGQQAGRARSHRRLNICEKARATKKL